jgi:hypothetical protein
VLASPVLLASSIPFFTTPSSIVRVISLALVHYPTCIISCPPCPEWRRAQGSRVCPRWHSTTTRARWVAECAEVLHSLQDQFGEIAKGRSPIRLSIAGDLFSMCATSLGRKLLGPPRRSAGTSETRPERMYRAARSHASARE